MALPNVKINFKNGSIGGVEPMDDGVTLAIIPGLRLDADVDCLTYNDFVDHIYYLSRQSHIHLLQI